MPSENVTAHPVQLRYVLTSDDLLDGFAAQNRSIARPWYVRWLSTLLTVGLLAVVFVSSAVSGDVAAGTAVIGAVVVFIVVVPVVVGFSLLLRRLFGGSRWIYRLQVRQIMRGNPALSQPMQATVTDTGVHLSSAAGQSTTSWAQHQLHVETDRSFVLLASERRGGAVLVLPKRGLDAAGLAPLRSLLSAHSRRIS
ncbi:YcxB family protein [Micromonospora purpureochromogenes]|uniref:YcxB family protein n=1 Tax=Micromonospora purpureochromogenes TaxID=47872 RepID=UPI0033EC19C4